MEVRNRVNPAGTPMAAVQEPSAGDLDAAIVISRHLDWTDASQKG